MKKITICFIVVLFFNIFAIRSVYAGDGILEQAQQFINAGQTSSINTSQIKSEKFEELAGLLQGTGILIAVGTAIVLGIRFMMASAAQKSEIKQSATPFLIGTIIILGALTIWKLLIEVLDIV